MKRLFLLLLAVASLITTRVGAQDTTRVKATEKEIMTVKEDSTKTVVKVGDKDVVTVTEEGTGTVVKVGEDGVIVVDDSYGGDTVKIRIGNRNIKIVDNGNGTSVRTSREPSEKKKVHRKFDGHWGGFEMGINTFHTTDYSLYEGTEFQGYDFFDLNHGKSLTVNINIAETAFSNERKTIGVVTGLGFSFMDFRFDQANRTIAKGPQSPYILEPVMFEKEADKSKFNVVYLTAPLMLEIATPLKLDAHRLTLGAGVIGGLNIGSHTKVKNGSSKDKERGSFNLNPLKYDLTGRIGFGDFCLFANYGMTPLFKTGKGPELVPLTIGISFTNASL